MDPNLSRKATKMTTTGQSKPVKAWYVSLTASSDFAYVSSLHQSPRAKIHRSMAEITISTSATGT